MARIEKVKPGVEHLRTVSLLIMCVPALVFAQSSEDLKSCSQIDDVAERVACYDDISGRQVPVTEETIEAAAAPLPKEESKSEEYVPLSEDIGTEGLGKKDEVDDDKLVRGRVTSCRQDSYDNYLFYFDNGQVWKQKDDDRLFYKDCNFSVMISKDFFGYKMQIDGEKKKIRISRIR